LPKQTVGQPKLLTNGAFHQLAVLAALLSMSRADLVGAGSELSQPLFIIQKSTNANVVHYYAVITPDGDLDSREPIIAFGSWQPRTVAGRTQHSYQQSHGSDV
jgi:hypothetical protein